MGRFDGRTPGPWESIAAESDVLETTDAFGHVTRPYGRTYPSLPAVFPAGRNAEQVSIYHAGTTTDYVTFEFRTAAGTLKTNTAVRFDWIAMPSTV